MSVPTSLKLRQIAGLVDKISNFGAFPPTEAYSRNFGGQGVCLNLNDPDCTAAQIAGIRSHGLWAGVWVPVPPPGDDGAARAKLTHEKIVKLDAALAALDPVEYTVAQRAKVDIVWLNLEGYSISQWREFLWGHASPNPGTHVKGWRGSDGAIGSSGGYRSGIASGVIEEPFKDGSVKPMQDLMLARVMLAIEGFYGPTTTHPDMTPADHPQAIIDRVTGQRNSGPQLAAESWPVEQVVGCYDAALGAIVAPPEPLLIRSGLHFTLERARQVGLL